MRLFLALMVLVILMGEARGQYILTQPDIYQFFDDYWSGPLAFEDINDFGEIKGGNLPVFENGYTNTINELIF